MQVYEVPEAQTEILEPRIGQAAILVILSIAPRVLLGAPVHCRRDQRGGRGLARGVAHQGTVIAKWRHQVGRPVQDRVLPLEADEQDCGAEGLPGPG